MSAARVAPALAAGCPFVLKPASLTPIGALVIAEVHGELDQLVRTLDVGDDAYRPNPDVDLLQIGEIQPLGLYFVEQPGKFIGEPRSVGRRNRRFLGHDQVCQQ